MFLEITFLNSAEDKLAVSMKTSLVTSLILTMKVAVNPGLVNSSLLDIAQKPSFK
ncbi:MAG: Uncharacterised protein [Crocinitomicaceae bacterium]|nr:MAG: Uncharacterised protein [Crocinitomicaceae bacterium]